MAREHLQVRVGADTTSLNAGLGRASRSVDRWAGGLKTRLAGMFGASVLGFGAVRLVKNTVDYASKMTDLAAQTGLAVEEMQRLDRVARTAGIELEVLVKAFQNLERRRYEALRSPTSNYSKAFGEFGISQDMLRTMSGGDIMRTIGKTPDLVKMMGPLADIFERSGPKMIEALSIYAGESMQNMSVISAETAQQLDAVADSFEALKQELLIGVAPALAQTISLFAGVGRAINKSGGLRTALTAIAMGPGTTLAHFFSKNGAYQKSLDDSMAEAWEKAGKPKSAQGGDPFTPTEVGSPTLRKRNSLYSDNLLSVGNFLGSGGQSAVLTVAQRQLRVQQDMNRNIQRLLDQVKEGGFYA